MNLLELVVTERNRLVRYSIITSIVSLVLATWARDAQLHIITPFSGEDVGNITVGHAVLIGQPIVCVLFFLLCAQISRYKNLVAQLSNEKREHLDWKFFSGNDVRGFTKFAHSSCEFFKWFSMIGVPALASFFLFFGQFDLEVCGKGFSYRNLFNGASFDVRPVHRSLRPKECRKNKFEIEKSELEKQEKETDRERIWSRMPKLYQPLNFLVGLFFQILVAGGLIGMFRKYFPRRQTTDD